MNTTGECLLNAVLVNTTGGWVPVPGSRGNYSIQYILTGTPTGGTVVLEGSNNSITAVPTVLATLTIGTDATGEMKFAVDKPVAFVRAKLAGLTGGTAPSVSAFLAVGG